MNEEDELNLEYKKTRLKLEEQEDTISVYLRKGQQLAEMTYTELRHLTREFEDMESTHQVFLEAQKELNYLDEEFTTELQYEKKKIQLQQEEAEIAYKADFKKLNNA